MKKFTKQDRIKGGINAGHLAVRNKTGIHGLSKEQHQQNSKDANKKFLLKHQIPEYRELHRNKIRLGKLISRFNKIRKPDFGFSR